MATKFFIAAMSLYIPLFFYWLGVGYYFYKRDTISRLELIVQEAKTQSAKKQVHSTSIGRAKVLIERTKVANKFIQMLGLIFLKSVPWPTVWMSDGGSFVTFNFSFIGGGVMSFSFYVIAFIYLTHFGYMLYRFLRARVKGLTTVRFGERFYFINRILTETLYIPALRILFFMLNCNTNDNTGELVVSDASQTNFQGNEGADIVCWEGWHLFVITPITLVCAFTLYPVSVWTLMDTSHETYTYVAKYNVIWAMGQTAMIAASVFLSEEPYLALLATTTTAFGLFLYDFHLAPVLGDGRYLNYWSAASFASVTWAGICSFFALLWDDTTFYKHWPLFVMIVGMPVVAWLAYKQALEHEEKRDQRKILQLKEAVQSKDLTFKLEAAENVAVLTLSDDRRELVAEQVLEPMVDMFVNPNTDDKLRAHVSKALANLAGNDNVRAKVFTPKLVKPLISMINNRRKMGIDNRRTAMMALCNMTFAPELCPMLVDRSIDPKGLEYSIEQCQSHDDSVRKSAAQAVVNCAYSKREEVEAILLTNRMLHSFIRLMSSKNLDMAILAVEILTPLVNPKTVSALMDAGLFEDKFLPSMIRSEWADVRYYGERLQSLVKKNAKGLQGVNVKGKMYHHATQADLDHRPELRRLDTETEKVICGGRCCTCFEKVYYEIQAFKEATLTAKSGGGEDNILLGRKAAVDTENWDFIEKARQDRQRLYAEEQEAAAAAKRKRRRVHRRASASTDMSKSSADIKALIDGEGASDATGPSNAKSLSSSGNVELPRKKSHKRGVSGNAEDIVNASGNGDEKPEGENDDDKPKETKEEKKARKKAEKEAKKAAKKEEAERKKAEKEEAKARKAAEKAAKKEAKKLKKAGSGSLGSGNDDEDSVRLPPPSNDTELAQPNLSLGSTGPIKPVSARSKSRPKHKRSRSTAAGSTNTGPKNAPSSRDDSSVQKRKGSKVGGLKLPAQSARSSSNTNTPRRGSVKSSSARAKVSTGRRSSKSGMKRKKSGSDAVGKKSTSTSNENPSPNGEKEEDDKSKA